MLYKYIPQCLQSVKFLLKCFTLLQIHILLALLSFFFYRFMLLFSEHSLMGKAKRYCDEEIFRVLLIRRSFNGTLECLNLKFDVTFFKDFPSLESGEIKMKSRRVRLVCQLSEQGSSRLSLKITSWKDEPSRLA